MGRKICHEEDLGGKTLTISDRDPLVLSFNAKR